MLDAERGPVASRVVLASRVIRVAAAVAAFGLGFAWAAPAAAIGAVAGVVVALTLAGVVSWLLRLMLQPGASPAERTERLVPRAASTVWVLVVAGACIYVAQQTHAGAFDGARGLAFAPAALPFALLALSSARQLHLGPMGGDPSDLAPDLDVS